MPEDGGPDADNVIDVEEGRGATPGRPGPLLNRRRDTAAALSQVCRKNMACLTHLPPTTSQPTFFSQQQVVRGRCSMFHCSTGVAVPARLSEAAATFSGACSVSAFCVGMTSPAAALPPPQGGDRRTAQATTAGPVGCAAEAGPSAASVASLTSGIPDGQGAGAEKWGSNKKRKASAGSALPPGAVQRPSEPQHKRAALAQAPQVGRPL